MRHGFLRGIIAVGVLAVGSGAVVSAAEDAPRALPTLLIKGEVVSVDTSDPNASLLKVKDRYGFETPIYLTSTTKIAKGDQAVVATDVQQGAMVEVEYNFDVNTAKRHAVGVKITPQAVAAAAAAQPAMAQAQVAVSMQMPPASEMPAPLASNSTSPAQPAGSTSGAPASNSNTSSSGTTTP